MRVWWQAEIDPRCGRRQLPPVQQRWVGDEASKQSGGPAKSVVTGDLVEWRTEQRSIVRDLTVMAALAWLEALSISFPTNSKRATRSDCLTVPWSLDFGH